jgi:hypothetical protein
MRPELPPGDWRVCMPRPHSARERVLSVGIAGDGAVSGATRSTDCVMAKCGECWGYVNPRFNWRGDVLCDCSCHAGDGNAPNWDRALERSNEIRKADTHAKAAEP